MLQGIKTIKKNYINFIFSFFSVKLVNQKDLTDGELEEELDKA